jgi:uncharacterized RDD family membrane protein YckC
MQEDRYPPPGSLLGHYAGIVSRLIAFVIDVVIISGLLFFTGWFITTSMKMVQFQSILAKVAEQSPLFQKIVDFVFSPAFYSIASLIIVVAYYLFFWTVAGQTIGKAVMGIKIVARRGGKLKLHQMIIRYFGYYVSAIPFGLGFLWIVIDDRRLAWHDKLAGTCVVYVWDARPDELFLAGAMQTIVARGKAIQAFLDSQKKEKG